MSSRRFWFIIQQDVSRPIGGIKQLYLLADILAHLGFFTCIVQKTSDFYPSWFNTTKTYSTISSSDFAQQDLSETSDILIIPETYLPIFSRFGNIPIIIFNQNMHYLHGEMLDLDPGYVRSIYTSSRLLHVLTVSQSDLQYVTDCYELDSSKVSALVNAIDLDLFKFSNKLTRNIAFMPRKNNSHSRIICHMLEHLSWFKGSEWNLVPIHDMNQSQVASTLQESNLFLAFGHPEGFGLPLAEAFACGCYVVGYEGIGGREIFATTSPYDVSSSVEYRDFHGFLKGVYHACNMFESPSPSFGANLTNASKAICSRYSLESMNNSVKDFLCKIDAF